MNPTSDPILDLLPLREPTFFILLSLAQGEKHGYAILKDIEALSGGKVRLSTGTLYEGLARLLDQGLIQRVDSPEAEEESGAENKHPGKPRKAYRLTRGGRRVLEAEIARMQNLVAAARGRLGDQGA
jgi:DNA-binding PadR family transcriptional regulator